MCNYKYPWISLGWITQQSGAPPFKNMAFPRSLTCYLLLVGSWHKYRGINVTNCAAAAPYRRPRVFTNAHSAKQRLNRANIMPADLSISI